MTFQTLLDAVDRYAGIKRESELESTSACDDWDCGIAVELGGQAMTLSRQQELDKARASLQDALNGYIDARVKAAIQSSLEDKE